MFVREMKKIFFLWTLVNIVINGINSLYFSGQTEKNAELHGRASLLWNVQDTMDTYITVDIFMNTLEEVNRLHYTLGRLSNSRAFYTLESKKETIRSSAYYIQTGSRAGNYTGEILFSIKNLTLNDAGVYILTNKWKEIARTTLIINYGPQKCGVRLKSNYSIAEAESVLHISTVFCGIPQPTLTCTFNGAIYNHFHIVSINGYQYRYSIDIFTKMESCDNKELICTATGYGSSIIERATVSKEYVPQIEPDSKEGESFVEILVFSQNQNKCSVSWESNIDIGICHACYGLQFMNGTHITTIPGCINETRYDCSGHSDYDSVRVISYVYGLEKITSHPSNRVERERASIRSLMDVDETNSIDHGVLKQRLKQQIKQLRSYFIIFAIGSTIAIISVLVLLNFLIIKRLGRRYLKKIGQKNKNNFSEPLKTSEKQAAVLTSPCTYTDLETSKFDATYQDIVSTSENRKNNAYEVCFKDDRK